MTQDPYLPDGCSQSRIDRAMGAMDQALEQQIDEAVADAHSAEKILSALRSAAKEFRDASRKFEEAHDNAARNLSKVCARAHDPIRQAIDEAMVILDELPSDYINPVPIVEDALNCLPSEDDLEAEMKPAWEENHGR